MIVFWRCCMASADFDINVHGSVLRLDGVALLFLPYLDKMSFDVQPHEGVPEWRWEERRKEAAKLSPVRTFG